MKATKQTEHLVAAFCAANKSSTRTSPEMDQRVLADVLSVYEKPETSELAPTRTNIGRIIMKSPLTKLAAAAIVLIACGIGLSLWRGTGSGIALADVLAQVEKAKTFRCKGMFTMSGEVIPGKPYLQEMRGTVLTSQEWGLRASHGVLDPSGSTSTLAERYFSRQEKTLVSISHLQKRYMRTEMDDVEVRRMQGELGRDTDPGWFLKEIMKYKYESLGRSTMDGMEVEGFRTTDPNCSAAPMVVNPQVDATVWVDVKTRMPVRVENVTSGLTEAGGRMTNRIVLHDIQWDVPVTAADFEPPAVPDGYLVVMDKLPGPITEEGTIQGLRQCVELLGKYPGSINVAPPRGIQSELDGSDSPAAVQLKEELKPLTEQERVNRLMEAGTPMRRVHRFFMGLMEDGKDAAYYGPTVTPKDAEKVLLRWKLSDNQYRVIFGDLRAETVSPEKLGELEKAPPK